MQNKYGFSGMEPRPVFSNKIAELFDDLYERIADLEAKLADKAEPKKAAAKKSAE